MSVTSKTSTANSMSDRSLSISMDLHPDVRNQVRTYPTIKDYYQASSHSNRPIQLQSGLTNYSNLQLGDDRISVHESILSEAYRLPVEEKLILDSPSLSKTPHARKRDYQEAIKNVGEHEVDRLEKVMKDKLLQRHFSHSGSFHVLRAFKFFDREHTKHIHIEGFTRALEFLGFQFSEAQNLALFARYDVDCTGEIEYMSFIERAMFYRPDDPETGVRGTTKAGAKKTPSEDLNYVADIDDAELREMQRAELRTMFDKSDILGNGRLNRRNFELLLMAMGFHTTTQELEACFVDMGLGPDDEVTFDCFARWWVDLQGPIRIGLSSASSKRK